MHRQKAVSGGYEYEFEISAQWFKKDNADNAKKLVIYAKENEFGNNSVGADEDGDIVFVRKESLNSQLQAVPQAM